MWLWRSLRDLTTFRGRLGYRSGQRLIFPYALWVVGLSAVAWILSRAAARLIDSDWVYLPLLAPALLLLVGGASLSVRRYHDHGISGWLLPLIFLGPPILLFGGPVVGSMVPPPWDVGMIWTLWATGIALALWGWSKQHRRGQPHPNRYGPPPRD